MPDPNVRTVDGVSPLDVLRTLTSDFLFKGAVPGLAHIEPNKLRLCLELVQSAALVISREEGGGGGGNAGCSTTPIYPPGMSDGNSTGNSSGGNMGNFGLDSRLVYLNLGAAAGSGQMDEGDGGGGSHQRDQGGGGGGRRCDHLSMYHHHHHSHEY